MWEGAHAATTGLHPPYKVQCQLAGIHGLEETDLWWTQRLVLNGQTQKLLPLGCCTDNKTACLKLRRECIGNPNTWEL